MEFYTYTHSRPDGTIFYIGKGQQKRAYDLVKRNVYWKRIVEKYGKPIIKIIANWKTEKEAFEHEIILISCFEKMGIKLANLTKGGEGSTGFKHTENTINNIKKKKIENPTKYWLGKSRSKETKEKIKKARLGVPSKSGNTKGIIIATNILNGNEIVLDGSKEMIKNGFSTGHVYKCVMGKRKTHNGYIFKRITL